MELGLDRRSCSPLVIDKIVSANGEHKSLGKAQKMLRKLAEISVSIPLIEDYTGEIGGELSAHLKPQAEAHAAGTLPSERAEPPRVVTVSVDGGRIMTRAEGTRGVHEPAWKETKNACLLTMSSETFVEDPHPQLPTCFQQQAYVEKLVREIHAARAVVARTVTYLTNNESRMNYPEYRKAGLPVSSAMIESLIKEINYRVKGTEKFWNRPDGAEAILQVRAAVLDDNDRLTHWILNRPGSPHHRRSTPLAAAA